MSSALLNAVRIWMYAFVLLAIQSCTYAQSKGGPVYITKTGSKYHTSTCQYLRYSRFEITYDEAVKRGYQACLVCKPKSSTKPNSVNEVPKEKLDNREIQKVDNTEPQTESIQCKAKTKKGTRCKRMTSTASGYCWQHENN
jgi:hypothetical protein